MTILLRLPFFVHFVIFAVPICGGERPNILFIAIDDLNDWVGCLQGHPQVKTPHIDKLAARGTSFTNAHCQAPLCNPSRTSVMTGLRPSTTGVYGLSPWFRDVAAMEDAVTLQQYFSKHGYQTLASGKVFHSKHGMNASDDEFGFVGPSYDDGPRPEKRIAQLDGRVSCKNDWGAVPGGDHDRGDWKLTSWAIDRLNSKPKQPFFLSVGLRLPHVPLFATQRWFDLYPSDSLKLPPVMSDDRKDTPRFSWYLHWNLPEQRLGQIVKANEWKNLVQAYLACTSFVDSQVGRLLDTLEENELSENTIVVLWSDHGWHLGEKMITGKNTLWERSTRVPLIFAGPNIAHGAKCDQPVELLDIYPSLVDICGLPATQSSEGSKLEGPKLEGHSLRPQLQNAEAKRPWPAITTANQNNHSVRTKDLRFIQYANGSEELYNMKEDPNEWTNVIKESKYQSKLAELRSWLPKLNAEPVEGSRGRILTYKQGTAFWEGKSIAPTAAIPGL